MRKKCYIFTVSKPVPWHLHSHCTQAYTVLKMVEKADTMHQFPISHINYFFCSLKHLTEVVVSNFGFGHITNVSKQPNLLALYSQNYLQVKPDFFLLVHDKVEKNLVLTHAPHLGSADSACVHRLRRR